MKSHELKCHPHFFEALSRGDKNFEIRRNDRRYATGDVLIIRKFDPSYGLIPGEEPLRFKVTYLMSDEDFPGILPGFVIMGIKPWSPFPGDAAELALAGYPNSIVIRHEEAKPIGEVVSGLPILAELERCNEYRDVAGLPRIDAYCPTCIKGPCKYPKD